MRVNRRNSLAIAACAAAVAIFAPATLRAQRAGATSGSPARAAADSAANQANRLAVFFSGVWNIDGEYKGTGGVFYKLTGYFAYVSSTPTSRDDGDAAVISMYLEPMAGGTSNWLGASLRCTLPEGGTAPVCLPVAGAEQLLELNFVLARYAIRGDTVAVQITQPDSPSGPARMNSTFINRGKFVIVPP